MENKCQNPDLWLWNRFSGRRQAVAIWKNSTGRRKSVESHQHLRVTKRWELMEDRNACRLALKSPFSKCFVITDSPSTVHLPPWCICLKRNRKSWTRSKFWWEEAWLNPGSSGKNCVTASKSTVKPGTRQKSMQISISVRTIGNTLLLWGKKIFLRVRWIACRNRICGAKISEQAFKRDMGVTRGWWLYMKTTLVRSMFSFRDEQATQPFELSRFVGFF